MADNGVGSLDPLAGQLQTGTIVGFDPVTNVFQVQIDNNPIVKGTRPITVSVPGSHVLSNSNGLFIGSFPSKNTSVVVGQGANNKYYFVSYKPEQNTPIPTLKLGELVLHATDTARITLDTSSHINIGSKVNKMHIFAGSQQLQQSNYVSLNFENENHFTQGYREVGGVVRRDLKPNLAAASYNGDSKLEDDSYDRKLFSVGMDPKFPANLDRVGPTKNPPLAEHREIVYEFMYNSEIDDDITEAKKYTSNVESAPNYTRPNRRKSRSDTLSLSLVSPNYLIESVKGTVVDIFGNILDLNRRPLPIGKDPTTSLSPQLSTDQKQSFVNIRALQRKSIAYHFEISARKDPNPKGQGQKLDIVDDNYNAKLRRSRFFLDVDKEGQFKFNVPASSETGNVPVLVRYENYSTFGKDDNGNPNKLWQREDNLDIFLDSFASKQLTPNGAGRDFTKDHGSITIKNGDTDAGPQDRLTDTHIRHGTPHHDILQTCSMQQNNATIQQYPLGEPSDPSFLNYINGLPNLTDIVSKTIQTLDNGKPPYPSSGGGANAGGRSGSINMDGSLELSLGANTVDRQSLWLDTAGGMVANIGRDRNQRSAIMNLDGDLIMQIGGYGVSGDARFLPLGKDGMYNAVLDLRVFSAGFAHMVRIDPTGVTIMSPQMIKMHAAQGMTITSDGPINIDCTTLTIYQRAVQKLGPSI